MRKVKGVVEEVSVNVSCDEKLEIIRIHLTKQEQWAESWIWFRLTWLDLGWT